MKSSLVVTLGAALIVAGLASLRQKPAEFTASVTTSSPSLAEATAILGRVPAAFVPNLGQWEHPALFVAQIGGVGVFLEEGGFALSMAVRGGGRSKARLEGTDPLASGGPEEPVGGAAVRLRFCGARAAEIAGEARLAGENAYFLGNDPSRWKSGVPRFGAVRYRGPWPGVDVVCYEREGHLEYDLVLSPGAALAPVEFAVEGAQPLRLEDDGTLVLETAVGVLRQPRPATFAVDDAGGRTELLAHYELRGPDRFGFVVPEWGGECGLVVDPGLLWSTFVGGTSDEAAAALSVDASGVVTIAGYTTSVDYPTTPGAWDMTYNGPVNSPLPPWANWGSDVFVTRLDPSLPSSQQLLYSTFVGGGEGENASALSVDASGVVTIAGSTNSLDYPTTPGAWDTTHNGAFPYGDAFVTRLDPSQPFSQQLLYSTFVGGDSYERVSALSVDASGVVTIAGTTRSTDYPTTPGAWDTTHNGYFDVFVTRLDPSQPSSQQLLYSTFVGGVVSEHGAALSVDASGIVTIAGYTNSLDYPTTQGAWDTTYNGVRDVFVTRLDPSQPASQQLLYSTFVGGGDYDEAYALSVDASGIVTIAGSTNSLDYPTTQGAWDTTHNGGFYDVFVTRLDPSQPSSQQLLYSTFVGGAADENASALSVDASGVVTIAGITWSLNYPTTPGAWDTTPNGGGVFVTRLDPSQPSSQQFLYSTFVGGADSENGALSVDAAGVVTITGGTVDPNYPTTPGAWDTTYNGGFLGDVFVTRLDMFPTGASPYGASTPGCAGPLAIGVTSIPRIGNADFAITCTNAPPNALGFLGISGPPLANPVTLQGAQIWIDIGNPAFFYIFVPSNGVGYCVVPLPLPAVPALVGFQASTQFAWGDACAPAGLSASFALSVTIQP